MELILTLNTAKLVETQNVFKYWCLIYLHELFKPEVTKHPAK